MNSSTGQVVLDFTVTGSQRTIPLAVRRLIIAGYTGRDTIAVRKHIDELAAIGVPPPARVPMFYDIPASLVTSLPAIAVDGVQTSGEVEPVLVHDGEAYYVTLGSDHTDRDIERRDVAESKASAPKPVATQLVPLDRMLPVWDGIEIWCEVDGQPYQRGSLAALLHPDDLLGKLAAREERMAAGTVMFCGTLPVLGGQFVFGTRYDLQLRVPGGPTLTHSYQVTSPGSHADVQA